jgi:hypothetical protein
MDVPAESLPPWSLMVWSVTDRVIEDRNVLRAQFGDLHRSGFGGVAAFVRCSRYSWYDEPAQDALREISRLCRKHRMHCWLGPDPRFVSRELVKRGKGLELILFGDRPRADVFPHLTPIAEGRFNVRCELVPRHVHMLKEVAIEYAPLGIERLYAVRAGKSSLGPGDIVDLTSGARLFYNARDRYIEAFGRWTPPDDAQWSAIAFFKVSASHVDYSDAGQMRHYAAMLADLKEHGVALDALMWDEPGFTCTYGTLPFTSAIVQSFRKEAGLSLSKQLWKMAFDSADGSQIPLRTNYYAIVQRMVNRAQDYTSGASRRLWGKSTLSSIHDTWHFESADMCDMNHGSMDLWMGAKKRSGGFVDLGDVQKLRRPDDPWYAHLAALSVICASLGKLSECRFAYNNLWTVGDDDHEGWLSTTMDHCVNVMAAFGTRWLAHAYGPVGTIGQERSFLGSPPLPGYPDHSTWPRFPEWNERLREHFSIIGQALPSSNVLVVFPVESLYALADPRADAIASSVFKLVLALLDAHYHVDVLSPSQVLAGQWSGNRLDVRGQRYSSVVYPHPTVVNAGVMRLLARRPGRVLYAFGLPERTVQNKPTKAARLFAPDAMAVLQWLQEHQITRPVVAPPGTWVTLSHLGNGQSLVCVVPSRHGIPYEGKVSCFGQSTTVPSQTGLMRMVIETPEKNTAR